MKKLAIITGGNSGLGFEIASTLANKGYNIFIIGKESEKLYDANMKLREQNQAIDVFSFCGNIGNEDFVKSIYRAIDKEEYRLEYLFNCAGAARFGEPTEVTKESIDINIEASLIGTILMSTQALKIMDNKDGGTIVNIMSTSALKGNSNEAVYCAAKWGQRGYTESLKSYTKDTNINVVSVYPGGMNTPFWNSECGKSVVKDYFMDPKEVANEIINAVLEKSTLKISELIIERK